MNKQQILLIFSLEDAYWGFIGTLTFPFVVYHPSAQTLLAFIFGIQCVALGSTISVYSACLYTHLGKP